MWLAGAVLVMAAGLSSTSSLQACPASASDSCEVAGGGSAAIIPVVDLAKVKTEREEQADILIKALEGVGFIYVDNIEGYQHEEILNVSKWFFGQPFEKKFAVAKRIWNPESKYEYRGYYPLVENVLPVSNKEALEFGMDMLPENYTHLIYELNPWPEDGGPAFRNTVEKYRDMFANVGLEMLRLLAVGMGLDEHTFEGAFTYAPLSTFRLLHYPVRSWEDVPEIARDGDRVIQCAEHKDTSFMTFVATFSYTGLELLDEDNNWVPIAPRPDSLVMNIGRLLSDMSGNRFKATRHRVMDPGVDRYSIAFFFEPHGRTDVNVPLSELGQFIERPPSHKADFYGNWMVNHTKVFYEYRDTDFGPPIV